MHSVEAHRSMWFAQTAGCTPAFEGKQLLTDWPVCACQLGTSHSHNLHEYRCLNDCSRRIAGWSAAS